MKEIKRYRIPIKVINFIQLCIFIAVIVIVFLFSKDFLKDSTKIRYSILNDLPFTPITFTITVMVLFYLYWKKGKILLHESCHKKMANHLDYQAEIVLKENYCDIQGEIKRTDFQRIALAPFVVESIIAFLFFCISFFITPRLYMSTILLLIFTLFGVFGDLYMFIVTLGHPKNAIYCINREDTSFSYLKNKEE